jgi:hypothetical protein
VCIELTKLHQRVERGYLSDLAAAFTQRRVRGEVTMVIAGSHPRMARAQGDAESAVPCGGGARWQTGEDDVEIACEGSNDPDRWPDISPKGESESEV